MSPRPKNPETSGSVVPSRPDWIKGGLRATAFMAILILGLMIVFFLREGANFINLYREQISQYRMSGLELVDIAKNQREAFLQLNRTLDDIRADWLRHTRDTEDAETRMKRLEALKSSSFEDFRERFAAVDEPLLNFILSNMRVATKTSQAMEAQKSLENTIRRLEKDLRIAEQKGTAAERLATNQAVRRSLQHLQRESRRTPDRLALIRSLGEKLENNAPLTPGEHALYLKTLRGEIALIDQLVRESLIPGTGIHKETFVGEFEILNRQLASRLEVLAREVPIEPPIPRDLVKRLRAFGGEVEDFLVKTRSYTDAAREWDRDRSVTLLDAAWKYLGGTKWVVSAKQQNWFGLLPLLGGSILVAGIALGVAAPLGIGGALYTNRFASQQEKQFLRPFVDFVSALPTVLVGFIGLMVVGDFLSSLSEVGLLSWLPGLPIHERLNAFTAGCLLAVMTVPTIFKISENTLERLPRDVEEASLALGASQWRTLRQVTLPSAMPGFLVALLIGFSRAIGETMIVLLVAGNRISIPAFDRGFAALFEPVHTMTGIIAQEMGEVVQGSLHYRALFMTAIMLFVFTLALNILAQWILRRFGANAQMGGDR